MRKMKFIDLLFVFFIFAIFVVMHEIIHYQINKAHGCENIGFKLRKDGVFTSAICPDNSGDLAHDINEIVGYNIMPILILIFSVLVIGNDKDEPIGKTKKKRL